jgi:hypothetical protein
MEYRMWSKTPPFTAHPRTKGVKKPWSGTGLSSGSDHDFEGAAHDLDRVDLTVAAPHFEMQMWAGRTAG